MRHTVRNVSKSAPIECQLDSPATGREKHFTFTWLLAVLPHYYCSLDTRSCTALDSVQFTETTMPVIGLIDECVCRHPHFISSILAFLLEDVVVALKHGFSFAVSVLLGELCFSSTWRAPTVCGHLHVLVVSLSPALACLLCARCPFPIYYSHFWISAGRTLHHHS